MSRRRVENTAGPLLAACHGELENVKYLVDAGADINIQLSAGSYGSALTAAASSIKAENVKYLVKAGADVNISVQKGGGVRFGSALAAAAYMNEYLEIVKCLIEAAADTNKPLEHGDYDSALAAAGAGKEYGDEDLFVYPIEAGADVNMPLEHGAAAAWRRIYYKLEILFNAGVDINMGAQGTRLWQRPFNRGSIFQRRWDRVYPT